MQNISKLTTIILFLLSIFLCLYKLDKYPVQQWDEATNISVVNETLKAPLMRVEDNSSERIIGGLVYQNQPFFEKPPVWYFATMGITAFCKGTTRFDELTTSSRATMYYRLISAMSCIGITLIVYLIAKKQWGHWTGIISGFSLLSIGHLFINNVSGYFSTHTFRSADLDALQILFIMLGILFFIKNKTSPLPAQANYPTPKNKNDQILVFLFSAFAVMTKGPLGFLPIIILLFNHPRIAPIIKGYLSFLRSENLTSSAKRSWFKALALNFSFVFKKFWQIIKTHHLLPFFIFILITIPWHVWMYTEFGKAFIDKYFFYHIVKRATTTIEEHKEHLWFYLQMFLEPKVFIIGVPVIAGIAIALKNKVYKTDIVTKTAILGILIPLIFFTIVPTKLAWYNLYIYPFAAILVGYLFNEKFENKYLNAIKNILLIELIIVGIIQNIVWVAKL